MSVTVLISLKVAEVANVADLGVRTAVSLVVGVVVRSSSLASLNKITYSKDRNGRQTLTILMNVESVMTRG